MSVNAFEWREMWFCSLGRAAIVKMGLASSSVPSFGLDSMPTSTMFQYIIIEKFIQGRQ